MKYEVEQKFPVTDLPALEAKLVALGAVFSKPGNEIDHYYAHPSRDFSRTDEALRIRRADRANYITYKGPKVDTTTKTRREIEIPLSRDETHVARWESILEALGFTPVGEVCKSRRKAMVPWQGRSIEASLDNVIGLAPFLELELAADDEDLDEATASIRSLAQSLGLVTSERRSYLELLLLLDEDNDNESHVHAL